MKINHLILNIPPHISTSWDNIASIHKDGSSLIVTLKSKNRIKIPNLEDNVIELIFDAHAKHLENSLTQTGLKKSNVPASGFPIKFGIEGLDSFASAMHHDPRLSNSPDLPKDVLEKIASISKAMGIEDKEALPKPEPHCNCPHCQIAKALNNQNGKSLSENDCEDVSDDDLKFRDWDISQTGEKLYTVTNPLNTKEQYSVYLGTPLGCTCGQKNCEHLRAVLNS
jgi:hypothetical protein